MEDVVDNLEISDILFANYSKVYAQVLDRTETGLYHVFTGRLLYKIAIFSDGFRISRWSNVNYSPNKLFYRKLDINSFPELESFILSKLLLE